MIDAEAQQPAVGEKRPRDEDEDEKPNVKTEDVCTFCKPGILAATSLMYCEL